MTPPRRRVLVLGAGWSGAVIARRLTDAGLSVEVLERDRVVGGHSRIEQLNSVYYEPNGPHLLHTDNPDVAAFFEQLGLTAHPYRFRPLTEIELHDGHRRLMSWPIQLDELGDLSDWPVIKAELEALPDQPAGDDFETYVVSMMGRRLYELFIEGYTRKQWGRAPSELSSSFAPRRVDLRRDGCRDLFRDRWQFFPPEGVNGAIESLLAPVAVTCGADVRAADLWEDEEYGAIVITAPLDEFAERPGTLEWRGVQLRSTYYPCEPGEKRTAAYVINHPSFSVPYTRTIETKHASGQQVGGTVVGEEYPGAPARHYPVAVADHRYEQANLGLQAEVRAMLAPVPVYFCGRLATYRYINQDEAIMGAWECADAVLSDIYERSSA